MKDTPQTRKEVKKSDVRRCDLGIPGEKQSVHETVRRESRDQPADGQLYRKGLAEAEQNHRSKDQVSIERGKIMTYEEIKKANETIATTTISGKEYAEVNQRIKAFRMVYPQGFIHTEIVSVENGVCIIRAKVGYEDEKGHHVLGTGTAYEKEGSTFINKTSYIENCETSAVGRALGMMGFGIDTSVASAEELQNAKLNQEPEEKTERKASAKQIEIIAKRYTGDNLTKLLQACGVEKLEDLPLKKASDIITALMKKGE